MEYPRIFNHTAVKVSRRVTDGLGSKWLCIMEELDEQLNLTISFTNKTHVLEGQFNDIIKARNLILHQLELQKVSLCEESLDYSTMQTANHSMFSNLGMNEESDSCRLSIQGSVRSNPSASGTDVSRTKSSTPISMQKIPISQNRLGLLQQPIVQVSEGSVSMVSLDRSMQKLEDVSKLPNHEMGVKPKQYGHATEFSRGDGFSTENVRHMNGRIGRDDPRQEGIRQSNKTIVRKHSQESFASSMPSLEGVVTPEVGSNLESLNLQESDLLPERSREVMQNNFHGDRAGQASINITPAAVHKKDDIAASLQQLENEYENAKRQSSSDEETISETDRPDKPGAKNDEPVSAAKSIQAELKGGQRLREPASSPDQNASPASPGLESADKEEEVKAEMTYVDTNTWKFMQKTNKVDLEDISRKNKVFFNGDSEDSELCCVTVTPTSTDANVSRALKKFCGLYEETMEECVQYKLQLASQVADDVIKRASARIQEIYPNLIIAPNIGNGRELTFICKSAIVKEIADNFRELVGMIPPRAIPHGSIGRRHFEERIKAKPVSGRQNHETADRRPVQYERSTGYSDSDYSEDGEEVIAKAALQSRQSAMDEARSQKEGISRSQKKMNPADQNPLHNFGKSMVHSDSEEFSGEEDVIMVQSGKSAKVDDRVQKEEGLISSEERLMSTQKSEEVKSPSEAVKPQPKERQMSRPAFNVAEEMKKLELSKSQSPSLHLLFDLLVKEDPSDEIENMINKILNGEAVDDTGSGYFQDGLFTGDPTPMDNTSQEKSGKSEKSADPKYTASDYSSEDDELYGNFRQSTSSSNSRKKSDVVEEPKVDSLVSGATRKKDGSDSSSDDEDDDGLYLDSSSTGQEKPKSPIVKKKTDPVSKPQDISPSKVKARPQSDDSDGFSSSDDDDLYGDFKKSVEGIKHMDSYKLPVYKEPVKQSKPQVPDTAKLTMPSSSSAASADTRDRQPDNVVKSLDILPANFQPNDGELHLLIDKKYDIPGHPGQGAMVVTFNFEDGERTPNGQQRAVYYNGVRVAALIPNSVEGKTAYKNMKKAFDQRKLFCTEERDSTRSIVPRIAMKGKRVEYPAPGYIEALTAALEKVVDG